MTISVPIYRLKRAAKDLSRRQTLPLVKAQNQIARQEGFASWSLLAKHHNQRSPFVRIFEQLHPGDMVLLGARPGQGKTLLGLGLLNAAAKAGQRAAFYSLEYTRAQVTNHLKALDINENHLDIDTSDSICADYIISRAADMPIGAVIVIDYLQLLDQNRAHPVITSQLAALAECAKQSGVIMVLISQIDRAYDAAEKPMPDMQDIRTPNPVDTTLFTKAIFLNNGQISTVKP